MVCHCIIPCVVTLLGRVYSITRWIGAPARPAWWSALTSAGGNPYEGEQQILPLPASVRPTASTSRLTSMLAAAEGSHLQQDIWAHVRSALASCWWFRRIVTSAMTCFWKRATRRTSSSRVGRLRPTRVWAEDVGYPPEPGLATYRAVTARIMMATGLRTGRLIGVPKHPMTARVRFRRGRRQQDRDVRHADDCPASSFYAVSRPTSNGASPYANEE